MFYTTTKRNKTKLVHFVVFALIMFFLSACSQSQPSPIISASTSNPKVENVSVSFVTDFSDQRRLVGFVDNVFVGQVVSQDSVRRMNGMPNTFFTVKILENLKGDLSGEISVRQEGGIDNTTQTETLVLVENMPLILVGQEYLFASISRGGVDYHTIAPKYGAIPLMEQSAKETLITEFTESIANQIPYSPQDTARLFDKQSSDEVIHEDEN